MGDEPIWDEQARKDLRERLRASILGELRLGSLNREAVLQKCEEVHIEDAPESEREEFIRFSAAEYEQATARLEADRESWPEETDCDRLDRVELALRRRGILLWQASPCCDTCTRSELGDRIAVIEKRDPGFRGRVRGYAFFIDQNLPENLADDSRISVYLGYGWFSPNGAEVAEEVYRSNAIDIGREVCRCLRDEGFEVDWTGDLSRKIGLRLDWRRRTMLE